MFLKGKKLKKMWTLLLRSIKKIGHVLGINFFWVGPENIWEPPTVLKYTPP